MLPSERSDHLNQSEEKEERIEFLEHKYTSYILGARSSSDADLSYSCLMFQKLISYLSESTSQSRKKIPDKHLQKGIWEVIISRHKYHIQQEHRQLSLPDLEIAMVLIF